MLLKEMENEANTTRKMLERVPLDRYDWKPHEKSMSLGNLAAHVAELPGWVTMTLTTTELDFAKNPYEQDRLTSTADLMAFFEGNLAEGKAQLEKATEEQLEEMWTLRNGDHIISTRAKADVLRMSFCQTVHHRAQLGVYLRLLNIPLPNSYGPTADDVKFR